MGREARQETPQDGEEESLTDQELLNQALSAMRNAYAPYSGFAVGACLLATDGRVFTGCNVENASFGLTICAERAALCKAVSEGAKTFTAIAIAARGAAPYPCGACRQVLHEFGPGMRVLVTWDEHTDQTTLDALLPHGFGPDALLGGKGEGA
ncbi:MAG: cytidine deaminase [Oscillospiraceae bacterium]|nr:cytidine deaminase [Oscillospiraceae bacterium]